MATFAISGSSTVERNDEDMLQSCPSESSGLYLEAGLPNVGRGDSNGLEPGDGQPRLPTSRTNSCTT